MFYQIPNKTKSGTKCRQQMRLSEAPFHPVISLKLPYAVCSLPASSQPAQFPTFRVVKKRGVSPVFHLYRLSMCRQAQVNTTQDCVTNPRHVWDLVCLNYLTGNPNLSPAVRFTQYDAPVRLQCFDLINTSFHITKFRKYLFITNVLPHVS